MVALVDSVTAVVGPVVTSMGVELVDVEHRGPVLRLVIDEPGGISLDRIAQVTRAASRALDLADPVPGTYTLEVSSPGLERPLRTPAHFTRAVGQKVAVKAVPTFPGERRLAGTLIAAAEDHIVVRAEAGDVRLPYDAVDRARTVFEHGPGPKPGKVGARPKAKVARAEGTGPTGVVGPGGAGAEPGADAEPGVDAEPGAGADPADGAEPADGHEGQGTL